MTRKLVTFACALAVLASSSAALAGNRSLNKLGVTVGLLGDPYPTVIGYNANWNVLPFMRLVAGYGSISASTNGGELKATTMAGGVRLMKSEWNFSPVVGLSYGKVDVTTTGSVGTTTVGGFSGSATHSYWTAGFDWQASGGFNFGFGVNGSLKSGIGSVPFINLGWFF